MPGDPAPGAPDPAAAATIARLWAEIVARDAIIAALEARISQLDAHVVELQARLRANSSNSSKPPSADGLAKGPPRPDRAARRTAQAGTRRKPGGQPGAPGAHLAQAEHPDVVVVHAPQRCQRCGGELVDAGVVGAEVRQVHDLPQLGLLVTEHRAERRRCGCGTVTAAAFPDGVRAPACYGPGVRAAVCYLHGQQHLPVERTAQARVRAGNQVVAGEPKTASGRRTLALDPATVAALRQHRKRQTEERLLAGPHYADSGLAFTMPGGTPIHPNRFSLWFRRHARGAGLPAIRLHDMRHSYATAGLAAGVPPKVISERLGHGTVAFTLDTYTSALPAMDKSAADVVAGLILGTAPAS